MPAADWPVLVSSRRWRVRLDAARPDKTRYPEGMGAHAIITGASSGIGHGLALELARRGYSVGLIARRADKLQELADAIAAEGGEAAVAAADVSDAKGLAEAIAQLEQSLGPCRLLVANAGIGGASNAKNLDLELVRRTYQVNTMGPIHAAHAVLPGMLERGRGQLVVISSIAASRGLPGSGAYSGSKAGVSTFWESMRVDLHDTPLVVTTIHPGFVRTPLTDKYDSPMPFMVETDVAARWMADAIGRGDAAFTFPWQMRWVEWLMRRVPNWIFDPVVTGRR